MNRQLFIGLIISSLVTGSLAAQTQLSSRFERGRTIANPATGEPNATALQVPLLGFLASKSPLGVRPIVGAPGAVVLGNPIRLPGDVTQVVPVPGQTFGIVERADATELAVLQLGATATGSVQPIPGTFRHADRLAFSPSGSVAVLYSASAQGAQVVTGLPASPAVVQRLDLALCVRR